MGGSGVTVDYGSGGCSGDCRCTTCCLVVGRGRVPAVVLSLLASVTSLDVMRPRAPVPVMLSSFNLSFSA